MSKNGQGRELPTIGIGWDNERHTVVIDFEQTDFKTWDFVIAILAMATERAKQARSMAIMEEMHQQAAQAQRINNIILGGGKRGDA